MEMMEDKSEIGKAFKEKFKDFSETPNPETWEKIRNSIPKSKTVILRYVLGGGILVCGVVGTGLFFMQTKEDSVSKPERKNIEKTEISQPGKSNYQYPVEFHLQGLKFNTNILPSIEMKTLATKSVEESLYPMEQVTSTVIPGQKELTLTNKKEEKIETPAIIVPEGNQVKSSQNLLQEGQTITTGSTQGKQISTQTPVSTEKIQPQTKSSSNPEPVSVKASEPNPNQTFEVWVPSAFTPAEATNNVFKASSNDVAKFEMIIYNRSGQQIFESKDINVGWDGSIKGSPAPVGAYVYIIRCTNKNGALTQKRGTVNLLR